MPEILIVTSVGDNHLAERLVWGCVWWCLPWGLKAGSREVMAAFPFVPRTMEKPARRGKTSHRCPNYDRCWFPLGQGKWEGREGGAGQKKTERPHGKITKVQIPRVMTTYLDHAFRSRVCDRSQRAFCGAWRISSHSQLGKPMVEPYWRATPTQSPVKQITRRIYLD